MNSQQHEQCLQWEQLIIDGVAIKELPMFNPELMLDYWRVEGFRPDALQPLKRAFQAWAKTRPITE